jgi:hypothetical protein
LLDKKQPEKKQKKLLAVSCQLLAIFYPQVFADFKRETPNKDQLPENFRK